MGFKLLQVASVRGFIGGIVGACMAIGDKTTRWTEIDRAGMERFFEGAGSPAIVAYWHGRIFLAPHAWPRAKAKGRPAYMLISLSKEGDAIAVAANMCGVETIRGSTARKGKDKGGSAALRALVRVLKDGGVVAVTPDGPKGPRMTASMGVVQIAKLSGAPIIPCAWSTRGRRLLGSWDRFAIPAPFSAGTFIWDAPIDVDREADETAMEAARRNLETALIRITQEADALCGVTPVEPSSP